MANTVTVKYATRSRLTLLVACDGTLATVIANATLLAGMKKGPLYDIWNKAHTTQATMRQELLERKCRISIRMRNSVAATTTKVAVPSADVDTDAVSTTKAEINLKSDEATTGQEFYVDIEMRGIGS